VGNGIGDRPHHLSDARTSKLPNSKLKIGIPILYYMNTFDHDARVNVTPHLQVETSFKDYQEGADPYLERVFAYQVTPQSTIDLPRDYLGSYHFSQDKSVNVFYEGKLPILELSSGWRTVMVGQAADDGYETRIPGLKIHFKDDAMHWILPSGDTIQMEKTREVSTIAVDLLKERKWDDAEEAYNKLKLTYPNYKATQRNNLTTQAFLFYYLLNDEELANQTMRLNTRLHKDKGFVFISKGLLYSAQGKKLKATGSFFTGLIKGYKD